MSAANRIFFVLAILWQSVPASEGLAQPLIVGSYYEDNTYNSCPGASACDAVFSKIPAGGGTVLITRVTCTVEISWASGDPGLISHAWLTVLDRQGVRDDVRQDLIA